MRNRFRTSLFLMALVWLFGQTGCVPQSDLQNVVITEDLLFVSGEAVRLSGRVFEVDGNIDDHGFYISKEEDFASPITVSLGPKEDGLGRFIGEYHLLDVNTLYYFKSYINVNGQEFTGQPKPFSSLAPQINSFHPDNGIEGNIVFIEGANFTQGTSVKIGGVDVEVVSIKDENLIEAIVPPLQDNVEVDISVTVQDTVMQFTDTFTYHFGKWELETVFPDNTQVYETMFFKDGNHFIFGLGRDNRVGLNLKVWDLDLNSYTWTDLNFPGSEGTRGPFNSAGYWGAGATIVRPAGSNINTPYFWRFNSGVFELKAFVPFLLYNTVGIHLIGELYVFGGEAFDHSPNRIVRHYNESTDTWDIKTNAPIDISSDYPYFIYNNTAYFFLPDNSIWNYNSVDDSWKNVGDFPDNMKKGGGAVILNNKVYIGLFNSTGRIWEWDIITSVWTKKTFFTGSIRDVNIGFFSHNDKVFFLRSKFDGGSFDADPHMELWSLNPTQLK